MQQTCKLPQALGVTEMQMYLSLKKFAEMDPEWVKAENCFYCFIEKNIFFNWWKKESWNCLLKGQTLPVLRVNVSGKMVRREK